MLQHQGVNKVGTSLSGISINAILRIFSIAGKGFKSVVRDHG